VYFFSKILKIPFHGYLYACAKVSPQFPLNIQGRGVCPSSNILFVQSPSIETIKHTTLEANMKLFKMQKFTKDESGAVTVDWVVLTAALVIIGGLVISIIRTGLTDASSAINGVLEAQAQALAT
jgi:Flp pilus assembly pilin Flp